MLRNPCLFLRPVVRDRRFKSSPTRCRRRHSSLTESSLCFPILQYQIVLELVGKGGVHAGGRAGPGVRLTNGEEARRIPEPSAGARGIPGPERDPGTDPWAQRKSGQGSLGLASARLAQPTATPNVAAHTGSICNVTAETTSTLERPRPSTATLCPDRRLVSLPPAALVCSADRSRSRTHKRTLLSDLDSLYPFLLPEERVLLAYERERDCLFVRIGGRASDGWRLRWVAGGYGGAERGGRSGWCTERAGAKACDVMRGAAVLLRCWVGTGWLGRHVT